MRTFALSCSILIAASVALAQFDPAAVARRYVETLNGGDVPAAVALFAADATVVHGRICTPGCIGHPAAAEAATVTFE